MSEKVVVIFYKELRDFLMAARTPLMPTPLSLYRVGA
jgi:hypothetical protein